MYKYTSIYTLYTTIFIFGKHRGWCVDVVVTRYAHVLITVLSPFWLEQWFLTLGRLPSYISVFYSYICSLFTFQHAITLYKCTMNISAVLPIGEVNLCLPMEVTTCMSPSPVACWLRLFNLFAYCFEFYL